MKANLSLLIVALLTVASPARAGEDLARKFQQGLFEEEANHNLKAAIDLYQSVLDQFDGQRKIAAAALFRLAEAHRKLGETDQAIAHYERLLREFGEQEKLAGFSRQQLVRLGVDAPAEAAAPAPPTREEADELAKVQEMMEHSPDLVHSTRRLHDAAAKGHLVVARFLLENGARINEKNPQGQTPLHLAAYHGHKTMAELLLESGADVAVKESRAGHTPLHAAAQRGYAAVAEVLLDHGAPIDDIALPMMPPTRSIAAPRNVTSRSPGAPLHLAVHSGHAGVVELLLARGATVNIRNSHGEMPLHIAVWTGNVKNTEQLAAHGADVNAVIPSYMPANFFNPEQVGRGVYLPGVLGASWKGLTPLHLAAMPTREVVPVQEELLDLLLNAGAEVDAKAGMARPEGEVTPLTVAAMMHSGTAVKTLLSHGAEVNFRGPGGETPLHHAMNRGSGEPDLILIETLLEAGADPNLPFSEGRVIGFPLHSAVYFEAAKPLAELLLKHGADLNARTEGQATVLHQAAWHLRKEMIEFLLDRGAEVNPLNQDHRTPLDVVGGISSSPRRPPPPDPDRAQKIAEVRALLLEHGAKSGENEPSPTSPTSPTGPTPPTSQ